jgi:hypothetical protein
MANGRFPPVTLLSRCPYKVSLNLEITPACKEHKMEAVLNFELLGYLASLFVAISLMMRSLTRLRVINLVGCAAVHRLRTHHRGLPGGRDEHLYLAGEPVPLAALV